MLCGNGGVFKEAGDLVGAFAAGALGKGQRRVAFLVDSGEASAPDASSV